MAHIRSNVFRFSAYTYLKWLALETLLECLMPMPIPQFSKSQCITLSVVIIYTMTKGVPIQDQQAAVSGDQS